MLDVMSEHVHHAIDYVEINVSDLAQAKAFYAEAFGWQFNDYGPEYAGIRWVEGDQVSAEYAGKGRQVDERGFFDTRDEGFLDEDDYLFIGGRTDDTIIRGAENVAPAEIEDVLMRHPAIADVAVVGLPDEQWGQRIVAAVVLREGQEVDLEQLREFARSTLRGSKTPEEIVIWSDLPRTETGKLVRRHVVQRFDATV